MNSRLIKRLGLFTPAIAALVLTGCATSPSAGHSMTVQTGRVVAAQPVDMQSRAGGGAAVGGILGYALTSSSQGSTRRARNTILGAVAGGTIAAASQGSLNGMQYTVEVGSGARIEVVTDQTGIKVGDCVNVEQAGRGTANVRRVSESLCEAVAANTVDAEIQAHVTESADKCLAAKERLMNAETEAQIEAEIRRVKILCDD